MKIKRFLSKDSRSAMAQVRAEMGPDAVILSNKKIDGQIELVAAMDFDEHALREKAAAEAAVPLSVDESRKSDESPTLNELQRELGKLRSMLEGELSQLACINVVNNELPRSCSISEKSETVF